MSVLAREMCVEMGLQPRGFWDGTDCAADMVAEGKGFVGDPGPDVACYPGDEDCAAGREAGIGEFGHWKSRCVNVQVSSLELRQIESG